MSQMIVNKIQENPIINMRYPITTGNKHNPKFDTEYKYTIGYVIYFVVLTTLAAFFSTSEAKSLFEAFVALLFKFVESISVN
jgi:hypothetical protein